MQKPWKIYRSFSFALFICLSHLVVLPLSFSMSWILTSLCASFMVEVQGPFRRKSRPCGNLYLWSLLGLLGMSLTRDLWRKSILKMKIINWVMAGIMWSLHGLFGGSIQKELVKDFILVLSVLAIIPMAMLFSFFSYDLRPTASFGRICSCIFSLLTSNV